MSNKMEIGLDDEKREKEYECFRQCCMILNKIRVVANKFETSKPSVMQNCSWPCTKSIPKITRPHFGSRQPSHELAMIWPSQLLLRNSLKPMRILIQLISLNSCISP